MNMRELARGSGHISIRMMGGELVVFDTRGRRLHTRPIYEGEWDELWNWIKTTPEEWEAEQ
tara:strand:- start:7184 stop:7366 length:183 start_codon:yes stop_codon:yes gene_type:complete